MTASQEQAHPEIARAAHAQIPRSYLYFGYTTLIDLISGPEQLRAWNAHELHPDLYFCGAAPVPGGYPKAYASNAEQARVFPYMIVAAHGARFLFGTDTPSAPSYANQAGFNGWVEMHRLTAAGLTPAQVFRAVTLSNAEVLGLSGEIGTVQAGRRANLLLMRQDPTQTIQAELAARGH